MSLSTPSRGTLPSDSADLSRMRHELRTPINHIIGYCEMLMEEKLLPEHSFEDLRRIHAGGKELQSLISHYFEEAQFYSQRNLHQLYHELRTPVNHIIGYSELLIEQAEDSGALEPIADLGKIRDAASNWLGLVEAYLIEPVAAAVPDQPAGAGLALNLGFTFKVPQPKSARSAFKDEGAILVVDDDETSREMLARRLRRCGYTVSAVPNGLSALALATRQPFDLVLLDMIMPGLDGFQVLAKFKSDPQLRETSVIMLSALDEENGIARCIEMGADDYLAKPFNPVFLRARIGACLEKKRLHDQERRTHEALVQSQSQLAAELAEAAAYVRSLLPPFLTSPVQTDWCFQPSQRLGGDSFGYHWIDAERLAIYLLDVSGHGVGAALLSVSALNAIRSHSLPGVDFTEPAEVLRALNRAFPMERNNHLFFTAWYGVLNLARREVAFTSAGHPPALLLSFGAGKTTEIRTLRTEGPAIGFFEDFTYASAFDAVPPGSRLFVFSDGVFEIFHGQEQVGSFQEFVDTFRSPGALELSPAARLKRSLELRGEETLEDDFSFLEIRVP